MTVCLAFSSGEHQKKTPYTSTLPDFSHCRWPARHGFAAAFHRHLAATGTAGFDRSAGAAAFASPVFRGALASGAFGPASGQNAGAGPSNAGAGAEGWRVKESRPPKMNGRVKRAWHAPPGAEGISVGAGSQADESQDAFEGIPRASQRRGS